jgi:DNA uptake protein ComE-like DNA-binding protein
LIVVAMLSLASYTFSDYMLVERKSVRMSGRQMQSRALADSGVESIKQLLMKTPAELDEAGGLYDNPGRFRGMLVVDDIAAVGRGNFTVIAPALEEDELAGIRFGLEDESSRLNLATLLIADKSTTNGGRQILMQLPNMTEEIADAILDWIDPDEEPREFGAELDHYSGQSPPYAPRNAVPETVEELLLVRDVTPELLFGPDSNRNSALESTEMSQSQQAGSGAASGGTTNSGSAAYARGWADYLTLYGSERNVQPDGTPRIDLNGKDLEQLYNQLLPILGQEMATFIIVYRQNGPYTGTKTGQPGASVQLDFQKQPKTNLSSVLELVGLRTQVPAQMQGGQPAPGQGQPEATILEAAFANLPEAMRLYLPKLLDHCTVNAAKKIPGRININQAPRTILLGIPGMTPEIVDLILAQREPEAGEDKPLRKYEAWILAEEIVTLEQMKALVPFICGSGSVYRAQVVGYYESEGPASRIEIVIDGTEVRPRVVFWRDLSNLGRGYQPGTLGLSGLQ